MTPDFYLEDDRASALGKNYDVQSHHSCSLELPEADPQRHVGSNREIVGYDSHTATLNLELHNDDRTCPVSTNPETERRVRS